MSLEKYGYINPFITSSIKIIKETTGLKVAKNNIRVVKGKVSLGGVGIILDIIGDVEGKVVFEFGRGMTIRLSSRMIEHSLIKFDNPQEFKKLLESAITELGNLISGRAITILEARGFKCDITPPQIFFGKGIPLIPGVEETIVIELRTLFGEFMINLAVRDNSSHNKKALSQANLSV